MLFSLAITKHFMLFTFQLLKLSFEFTENTLALVPLKIYKDKGCTIYLDLTIFSTETFFTFLQNVSVVMKDFADNC